jgi:hypothetical protein
MTFSIARLLLLLLLVAHLVLGRRVTALRQRPHLIEQLIIVNQEF